MWKLALFVLHGGKLYALQKSEMSKEGYRRRSSRIWALEEAAKFKQKEKEEKDKEAKEKQKEKLEAKQNVSSSIPLPDRKRGRKKKRLEEVVVSSVARVTFFNYLLLWLMHVTYAHVSFLTFSFFTLPYSRIPVSLKFSATVHGHHLKPWL